MKKLIKVSLFIFLIIFFDCNCNDTKITEPYDFVIYDSEYFKDKTLTISNYGGDLIPWKILDYNYYLLVHTYYGFVFIYTKNPSQIKELKSLYNYKDYFEVKVIEIDFKNPSNELFCTKFEEYLNTTPYYYKDKLNITKLNSIKNILKEYFYIQEQNIYDKKFENLTLKSFHNGINITKEIITENSVNWNFEISFNNKSFNVELYIVDNLYKLKINET